MRKPHPDPIARRKLVSSATRLMLERGFPATSIDDVCAAAKVTKGTFFHYFPNKEALGLRVLDEYATAVIESLDAVRARRSEPLQRVLAVLAFLAEAAEKGELRKGCMLGSFSHDLALTHPNIREVCSRSFGRWMRMLQLDLEEAQRLRGRVDSPRAAALAEFIVAAVEGGVILARANQDARAMRRILTQVRSLVERSFD